MFFHFTSTSSSRMTTTKLPFLCRIGISKIEHHCHHRILFEQPRQPHLDLRAIFYCQTPLVDDCTFWHHAFFNCTTPGSLIAMEFHKTRSQTIPPRPNHHRLYLARKLRNTDSRRMAECHYSQICFPHFQICHVSMSNGVVQSVLVIVKTRNINLHHVNPSLFSLSRSRSDEAIEATSNLHYQTLIGYLQNSDKLITIQQ